MKNDRGESNIDIVPRITEVKVAINSPYEVLVLEITFADGSINKETREWEDIDRPAQRTYLSRDIAEHMYAKTGEYLDKTDDDYPEPVKKILDVMRSRFLQRLYFWWELRFFWPINIWCE